jgi:hypothetical protein
MLWKLLCPCGLVTLLFACLVGCVTHVEFEDQGEVCLFSRAVAGDSLQDQFWPWRNDSTAFHSGDVVLVRVVFDDCISACSQEREASCTVTRDGTEITLHSRGHYEKDTGPGSCTSNCKTLVADCTIGPLPDGSYTVRHGEQTYQLGIPSSDVPICQKVERH